MRAADLTPDQRRPLVLAACRRRDYYGRLRRRMDVVGWDAADPVYVATAAAYDAAHELVRALIASVPPDPPRPPREDRRISEVRPSPAGPLPPMPWVGKPRRERRR